MKINTVHPSTNISFNRYLRLKAILVVLIVWSGVSLVHWWPVTQGFMLVLITILTIQTLRMLIAKPVNFVVESNNYLPLVSILVPAKNESAVLTNLVESLGELDYPSHCLDFWIIDDGSTDETPQVGS